MQLSKYHSQAWRNQFRPPQYEKVGSPIFETRSVRDDRIQTATALARVPKH